MRKIDAIKLCNILCILFTLGFAVDTILAWQRYSSTLNSAPFRLWVYVNLACYILPAIILFVMGRVVKKRQENESEVKQNEKFV